MHQNAVLLVDANDWDVNCKDLIIKVVCDSSNKGCMMYCCESCPGIAELKEVLDEQLCDVDLELNLTTISGRQYHATMITTYKNYKEIVIETTDE